MLVCVFFTLLANWQNCEPLSYRPPLSDLMQVYTPNPDCLNRDRHIRYLLSLKSQPVHAEDHSMEYDQVIDAYVARLQYYCR